MNKLTKTAKTLDKISRIAQICFTIVIIMCAVALVLTLLIPLLSGESIASYMSGTNSLYFSGLEIELAENTAINYNLTYIQTLVVLAMGGVSVFIASRACRCIRAILHPMTLGQPFDNAVSTNLKKLSNLTIWMGVATNLTILVDSVITMFAYNMSNIMNPEVVTGINMHCNLDLTFLLYFAILRLLSYVFRYGQELQQLSDETL